MIAGWSTAVSGEYFSNTYIYRGRTSRDQLDSLFSQHGRLIRIDMKKNYAFIQFSSISQATKAKDALNGRKVDEAVLTVEYVAQQRAPAANPPPRQDHRRAPPPRERLDDYRYDDRSSSSRYDDRRSRYYERRRSPPRYRSRSPRRYRSRSPRRRSFSPRRRSPSPFRDRGYR